MALTPEVRAAGLTARAVVQSTTDLRLSAITTRALINFPTESINISDELVRAVAMRTNDIRVSDIFIRTVVKGVVERPRVRAWTFTLDSHDFYIFQTINETLVCDLSNGRWYIWGTGSLDRWRVHTGISWQRSLAASTVYGSNIVAGDNILGTLYLLDPEGSADEHPNSSFANIPFRRVVVGQIALRGRASVPCWGIEIYGSIGEQSSADYVSVTLYTSDDRGHTFDSQGTQDISVADYSARLDWLSLGQMQAPGRLVMVEDYGALIRIDGMETPDAES